MSGSRNLGVSRKCVYADSMHMHTLINGISVILRLAEFDSAFKLPPCEEEEVEVEEEEKELFIRKSAHIEKRYTTCCPECKCGAGECDSRICSLKESALSIKKESVKSICSIKPSKIKPQKEKKPCKPRRPFCVFKRKPENEPKKRKAKEPKRKQKVKKIEAECTHSNVSVTQTDATPRLSIEDFGPPEEPEEHPPKRLTREHEDVCLPDEPEKPPSKREKCQKAERSKHMKNKEECIPRKLKKTERCRPVFVDVGTSTCSENIKHQYNVLQNKKTGFEMYNRYGHTISGYTQNNTCSIDTENLSSIEETHRENSRIDSDGVRYRFIACHLKESATPERLLTAMSKSATETRDCLEATLSIYSPSIRSMVPHRFDESNEILSTIVDHASIVKDGKGRERSTWPGVVFSTSTSAQTCLIDYELFKGSGCNPKVFRKDYVIEETWTNGSHLQKTDSSSV